MEAQRPGRVVIRRKPERQTCSSYLPPEIYARARHDERQSRSRASLPAWAHMREGPNVRWKTDDGELTRIRACARGESPRRRGSGCSAADLFAPPRICLLRPANRRLGPETECSGRRMSARVPGSPPAAGESPARRGIPLARPASRSLRRPFGRSASGTVCSAVRPPAPAKGWRLRRSNRSLRESYASFGGPRACSHARLLSSESKTPAAGSVRRLEEPERRLRRSTRPLGARSVGSGA